MKNHHSFDAELRDIDRLSNSPDGNPRFRVATSVGVWHTEPDSDQAIRTVSNVDVGRLPAAVTVTLSGPPHRGRARITDLVLKSYAPSKDGQVTR